MIVASLTDLGYEGFYSLEYERRWFPDQLPPPAVGMQQCLDFLRGTSAGSPSEALCDNSKGRNGSNSEPGRLARRADKPAPSPPSCQR